MPLTLRQLGPGFAAEASGLDLTQPISADDARAVHDAMDAHGVVIFRDQALDDETQMAFTLALGPIEPAVVTSLRSAEQLRIPQTFADVSNLDEQGRVLERTDRRRLFGIGNRLWHSDSSFKAVPAKYSLLHARTVPSAGGETQFADMAGAYDALDEATKAQCEGLICQHSQMYSRRLVGFVSFTDAERERMRPVRQVLVRTHPSTGRKSLYLSSHAGVIEGWPVPEALLFLRDLTEHATQPQFVYTHHWRAGDLVIWDNQRTMHRARPFPEHEPRDVRRTTLAGDAPTVPDNPVVESLELAEA